MTRVAKTTFKKAGWCRLWGFFTPITGNSRHVLGDKVFVCPGDVLVPGLSIQAILDGYPHLLKGSER